MEQVEYRDSDHTYWCRGRRYLSATQVLDMFKNKFDGEAVAEEYKDKAGQSKDYWLKTWDDTRVRSLERGNKIHNLREEITNNRGTEVWQGVPMRVRNPEMGEPTSMKNLPDGIYTEYILSHHGYGIAGRADKIILHTLPPLRPVEWTREMHVDDYKTNKVIKFQSFCHPRDGYKMMKAPLGHLMDCSGVHYQLQLSLYMLMGEYHGYHPGGLRIIHFPHIPTMAPPGAKPPPPVFYPVTYLKKEVISMLEYLKHRRVI